MSDPWVLNTSKEPGSDSDEGFLLSQKLSKSIPYGILLIFQNLRISEYVDVGIFPVHGWHNKAFENSIITIKL